MGDPAGWENKAHQKTNAPIRGHMKSYLFLLIIVLTFCLMIPPAFSHLPQQLPSSVMFVENVGQFDPAVRFQVRGGGGLIWLTQNDIWLTFASPAGEQPIPNWQGVNIQLRFVGANPAPQIEPFSALDTRIAYFVGNDPAGWQTNVPVWSGVRYKNLYPGLDLELTGGTQGLLPRLRCRQNCQTILPTVQLQVIGANGITLNQHYLDFATSVGNFSWPLFQLETPTTFLSPLSPATIEQQIVHYPFAPTPPSGPLLPNTPTDLIYSTFLGGSNIDSANEIIGDGFGNHIVVGNTFSTDFPTTPGAFDQVTDGADGYVGKFNSTGSSLVYATFIGGNGSDLVSGLVLDQAGNVVIAGSTESPDFPTTNGAFDTSANGFFDVFVAKLNPAGNSLLYGSFLGGSDSDLLYAQNIDPTGNIILTGYTRSDNFPTSNNGFDTTFNGETDVFVSYLDPSGSNLVYGTFMGGNGTDVGATIKWGSNGAIFIGGQTASPDFPTTSGAFDTSYNSGSFDAFVASMTINGLIYSSFLGGSDSDSGLAMVVSPAGETIIVGDTQSTDFPTTVGAFDTTFNGAGDDAGDAFVLKLAPAGNALLYATYFGGSSDDIALALGLDALGNVIFTGFTSSTNFPATIDAFDNSYNGGTDAFLVKLSLTGDPLRYSTFLGGSNRDSGFGLVTDPAGTTHIAGQTYSINFPTTNGAFDTTFNYGIDAFVTKLTPGALFTTPINTYLPFVLDN